MSENTSNRLANESSPYLLQHATNPVDWYSWGEEAFHIATLADKPIFLSVGYSTCHWCHVMAHESFEDQEVADLMNKYFICIKLDKEERPELDELYMTVTQMMTGHGGWPNSVWLTPEKKPWYAGTYFPKEDRTGHLGFKSVLKNLSEVWKTRRGDIESQAEELVKALSSMNKSTPTPNAVITRTSILTALEKTTQTYDETHGGFGPAPKFPPHHTLSLLLYYVGLDADPNYRNKLIHTLDAMALGGIYDQVGGGFHRYATDAHWFLPHFEKMLFDNAQLSLIYTKAYALTQDLFYKEIATETFEWLSQEMRSDDGGFYSALDADSEGEEGTFYTWPYDDLMAVASDDTEKEILSAYGAKNPGNYQDEATGQLTGRNILSLQKRLDCDPKELSILKSKLKSERNKRPKPFLDTKILASWNGLMLASLATAYTVFQTENYLQLATELATFLENTLITDTEVFHCYANGQAKITGYLDDYVFMAYGFVTLYEATTDKRFLELASNLMERALIQFEDKANGGFFFTSEQHTDNLIKNKDPYDKDTPSGNGLACTVLVKLANLTTNTIFWHSATKLLQTHYESITKIPHGVHSLLLGASLYLQDNDSSVVGPEEIMVTITPASPVRDGNTLHCILELSIPENWTLSVKDNQNPLALTVLSDKVTIQSIQAPSTSRAKHPEFDTPIYILEGYHKIPFILSFEPTTEAHPQDISFEMTIQACTDTICRPTEKVLSALSILPDINNR
ncbi:thioredoxin domain-containing protein [Candidatus Marinamargulisbacteria bacterium SCGC AG-439-L15]|nr:thioredoxin domain-containing protein [Candidatus Marinamargulisbacteria bacterium SCGC AG-439-L15]